MPSSTPIPVIRCLGDHPTVRFAGDELRRYLTRMTGVPIRQTHHARYAPTDEHELWVGVMADIPHLTPPAVADAKLDDAVDLAVRGGRGYLVGSNPRSVLFAVYRFLYAQGCRWVRPCLDGERVPTITALQDVEETSVPSYRHRGVCIEGATAIEHVRDMIDWMPKVGLNAYLLQFREAYVFWNRWYSHERNPHLAGETLPVEQARAYTARAIDELRRRDLLYHGVGHGWTSEALGVSALAWDQYDVPVTPDIQPFLAEIDGVRGWWPKRPGPLLTNLCYSNPEARQRMVTEIVRYAEDHPEIDLLHVWLADGSNNHCECTACRDTRPAAYYVMILNELELVLTARGLDMRIAAVIYVDLLWPPEHERLINPARVTWLFAPISRSFSESFSPDPPPSAPLPPFRRNALPMPATLDEHIAFLDAWRDRVPGDYCDFDYHLWWDQYKDPGMMAVAETLARDLTAMHALGLTGLISAMQQRTAFPTGLPLAVIAAKLWNHTAEYADIVATYFADAFGADGKACRAYLDELTHLFDPPYLRGEKPAVSTEAAETFHRIPAVIDAFRPVITRNTAAEDPCHAASWRYLAAHADLCAGLAHALAARAQGDARGARARWRTTIRDIGMRETLLHPVLDVFTLDRVFDALFMVEDNVLDPTQG